MVVSENKSKNSIRSNWEGANGKREGERNMYHLTILITKETQTKTVRYHFSPVWKKTVSCKLLATIWGRLYSPYPYDENINYIAIATVL